MTEDPYNVTTEPDAATKLKKIKVNNKALTLSQLLSKQDILVN